MTSSPGLFGLNTSNRDFSKQNAWGKNQFNSSFPAALCCYLHHKNKNAVRICVKEGKIKHDEIKIDELFGIAPTDKNIFFAFEAAYSPFHQYISGELPRTDLVIQKSGSCLRGLEIKLTALPDESTHTLTNDEFGSELVVRPDTIVYLACSLISSLCANQLPELSSELPITDWSDAHTMLDLIPNINEAIVKTLKAAETQQKPFLLQPVWKTKGKSPTLADDCLDVFVWTDVAFTKFITEIARKNKSSKRISRQERTLIWLYRMLSDFRLNNTFDHAAIIDELSYNTKNDKAFSSSGRVTNKYMGCERLERPVISKNDIRHIILGGGQHLLSPERRFDAIIYNTPELFSP